MQTFKSTNGCVDFRDVNKPRGPRILVKKIDKAEKVAMF